MNVIDFGSALEAGRPAPSREQYAAECELARTYLARNAPDLLDMVLGGDQRLERRRRNQDVDRGRLRTEVQAGRSTSGNVARGCHAPLWPEGP